MDDVTRARLALELLEAETEHVRLAGQQQALAKRINDLKALILLASEAPAQSRRNLVEPCRQGILPSR